MSTYAPGAAAGATIQKDSDKWTLVLVRELRHPPTRVWLALTDPQQLREWAPFDADRDLGSVGPAKLSTVGTEVPQTAESRVLRAEPHRLLELTWGEQHLRWELEPTGSDGTRLTLWHDIDRRFIAMGAAGWHICIDVMDHLLADAPIGRVAGPGAMQHEGWKRLHGEYAAQFAAQSSS